MVDRLGNEAKILPEEDELEQWVDCPHFEERYSVSTFGRIQNKRTGRMLSPSLDKNGYQYVSLYNKLPGDKVVRKFSSIKVHRLICEAFCGKPSLGKNICDHIDQCRTNNYYKNLHWVDTTGNRNNRTNDYKQVLGKSVPIVLLDRDGNFIQRFENADDAHGQLGLSKSQISANITGQRIPFQIGYFMTEKDYLNQQKV